MIGHENYGTQLAVASSEMRYATQCTLRKQRKEQEDELADQGPGWNARFPHPSKWHDAIMFARERGGWEHERNERKSLDLASHFPWKEGWKRGKDT